MSMQEQYTLGTLRWKSLSLDNGTIINQRSLAGGEYVQDLYHRLAHGETTVLFSGCTFTLEPSCTRESLVVVMHNAWKCVRFWIPTVAAKIQVHPENDSCMVYQTANIDCINKWVERTLIVHEDIPVQVLRRRLGLQSIPSNAGDCTWLHLIIHQAAPSTSVGTVSLLLHTHHAVFDGVAARNILAKIMGLAGQADRMCMDLKWGNEAENLTPAVFAILSDDEPLPIPTGSAMQPTADLPYYKSLNWFWNCLEIASKGVHSFDILPWQGSACIPWREEIVFNIGETTDVKNGLKILSKNRLQKYTITHLAHAALSMVLVADNPPKVNDVYKSISSFNVINCRPFLRQPYCQKGEYPAYALSLLMINIPLHIFFSDTHSLLPMDDFLLKKVMEVTQGCHAKHKDLPAKLSYMAQVSEIFGAALKRDSMAGRTISDPQSFWFVNDGVGENEMDTLYTLDDRKTIMKIKEAFTSVNRCQAAPAFRISSWGNKISISADFNLDIISVAKVIALLTAWKEFMMLIA